MSTVSTYPLESGRAPRSFFPWLRGVIALAIAAAAATWTWQFTQDRVAAAEVKQELGRYGADAARNALRSQPLSSAILRDLALALDGDFSASKPLLELAEQISRREPATQLLLLEASAQAGDTPGTLRHYDALLSTAPALHPQLIGVLSKAVAEPEIFSGLSQYAERSWFVPLVEAAANQPGGAATARALAGNAALLTQPDSRDRLAPRLITALSRDGYFNEAITLAKSIGNARWSDLGFSEASLDPRLGTLAWQIATGPSVNAEWRAPNALAVSVEPGRLVQIASRVTSLSPGSYRLTVRLETPSPPGTSAEWRIRCKGGNSAEVAVVAMPVPAEPVEFAAPIAIPAACSIQEWSLWAEAADAQLPSQLLLSQLAVVAQ